MNDMNALWRQRVAQYTADTRKYLKYMLNDHLKIVLIFILGGGAYYYQQWLETLSPTFPAALVMAVIIGILLTTGGIRTFLKQADLVFLLPLEQRMRPYFIKAFFLSFTFQAYILLAAVAALAPLYVKATGKAYGTILTIFLLFLFVKLVNFLMSWFMTYFEEASARWTDFVVRLALNSVFAYLLFAGANALFILAIAALIGGLAFYYYAATKKKPLKWEHLIELEAKRLMFFYRLANLFTDVPNMQEKIVRRAYMDWLLERIPFTKNASYQYLYSRTFLRAGDYLGLTIRLTVIGGLILWNAPLQYGSIAVAVITLYLTGFQLMPLWKHHEYKLWVSLYPVADTYREKAFLYLLQIVLSAQAVLLALVICVHNVLAGTAAIVIGLLFSQLFVKGYIRSKMKKM